MRTLRKKDARAAKKYFGKSNKPKEQIPQKYSEYIQSKFWIKRREKFLREKGSVCRACSSTINIQVHHVVYGGFGREKDEDLIALCELCHIEFHEIYGANGNMKKDTADFLWWKRHG